MGTGDSVLGGARDAGFEILTSEFADEGVVERIHASLDS